MRQNMHIQYIRTETDKEAVKHIYQKDLVTSTPSSLDGLGLLLYRLKEPNQILG